MLTLQRSCAVFADDLTGASDTALAFFEQGFEVQLWAQGLSGQALRCLNPTPVGWVESLNLHSRHLPPQQAYQCWLEAGQWVKQHWQPEFWYKKMDSTLRGNVVAEALALVQAGGFEGLLMAPAFPREGRQTIGGFHVVNGLPLERSVVMRDPLAPVKKSHLPTLVQEQLAQWQAFWAEADTESIPDVQLHTLPLDCVMKGAGVLVQRMKQHLAAAEGSVCLWVADAASDEDLTQLALAWQTLNQRGHHVLPCGSAGLAHALVHLWSDSKGQSAAALAATTGVPKHLLPPTTTAPAQSNAPTSPPAEAGAFHRPSQRPTGQVLLVSASTTAVNQGQLQYLKANAPAGQVGWVVVQAQHCWSPPRLLELQAQLAYALATYPVVVLTTCTTAQHVEDCYALGEQLELTPQAVSIHVLSQLKTLVQHVLNAGQLANVRQLVLCGGETAQSVVEVFDTQQLHVAVRLLRNVALCQQGKLSPHRSASDVPTQRAWVFKSGNMGEEPTLQRIVEQLMALLPPL